MPHRITGRTTTTPAATGVTGATGTTGPTPLKPVTSTTSVTTTNFTPGTVTAPTVTGPSAPTVVTSPTLKLIDDAKERLYLRVDDLNDFALQDHLVAAAKRGVDVHVVLTPKAALKPEGTMSVLRLTDDGIDVAVKQHSTLAVGAALVDQASYKPRPADPVTGTSTPSRSTAHTTVANALKAFTRDLQPVRSGLESAGLLAPNTVTLFQQPASTAQPILNALNAAKTSIDVEVYQVGDPDVTAALLAASKRGVKVRVMLEPKTVGSSNYAQMLKVLTAGGVEVKPTPPEFDSHRNVDHAKFLLVDGQELLLGSGNLVRYGLGGNEVEAANSRDFWVGDTRAGSLADARRLFEADWARTPVTTSVTGPFNALVVTPDNARSRVFATIDSATKELFVYNQSLSDPETIAHLVAAKQRGVDVKVLLGVQPIPHQPPKNQPAVNTLRAAGIDCLYLTKSYLHAKGIITEGKAFIGSQNFTSGGLGNNREVGEVVEDAAFVASAKAQFLADFAAPGAQP